MRHQWMIVGAGLVGCTLAERIATVLNERVLVVEARHHIGGNTYDELDSHGVLVHRYGPHIFHTNDERVWKYLSHFTEWHSYEHHVLAQVEGRLIPVPFNFNSLGALFPPDHAAHLERLLIEHFGPGQEIPILRLRDAEEPRIRKLADLVYEKVFYGYTLKQWGLTPEQLGPSVMARVPVRLSRENRYFRDRYQGIPTLGYAQMVQHMLSDENIEIALATSFRSVRDFVNRSRLIYTGSIDSYFDYAFGPLPYRSLRFEFQHHALEQYQSVAQVNYPNKYEYTRIVEHKHMTGQNVSGTTIAREYPQAYEPHRNEPYYPVLRPESKAIHARYLAEAAKLHGSVVFAGRLADYRYYNMDQAVARALSVFEHEILPVFACASGR